MPSRFDLVVVDIEMPRLSGLDVIRAIRARSDGRAQVPIVALTAYAMREHRERIAAAGANGLISKPITSIDALGRGLAAHVRRGSAPAAGDAGAGAGPDRERSRQGRWSISAIYEALCEAIGAEMMAELLEKVVADLLAAQRELGGALEPLDRAPIRAASHILISVAGAIGAARLQRCARRAEQRRPRRCRRSWSRGRAPLHRRDRRGGRLRARAARAAVRELRDARSPAPRRGYRVAVDGLPAPC